MAIQSYKDLLVWQKSMQLVHEVYRISKELPKMETYILIAQMLRAAISIPSNIAEGYKRRHRAEYKQFLSIAEGSAVELETQLLITQKEYPTIAVNQALDLVLQVQKMLSVLNTNLH